MTWLGRERAVYTTLCSPLQPCLPLFLHKPPMLLKHQASEQSGGRGKHFYMFPSLCSMWKIFIQAASCKESCTLGLASPINEWTPSSPYLEKLSALSFKAQLRIIGPILSQENLIEFTLGPYGWQRVKNMLCMLASAPKWALSEELVRTFDQRGWGSRCVGIGLCVVHAGAPQSQPGAVCSFLWAQCLKLKMHLLIP